MGQTRDIDPDVLRNLEDERFERRLLSKRKKKARIKREAKRAQLASKEGERFAPKETPAWAKRDKTGTRYLELPEVMDLITDFEQTAQFVRALHLAVFRDRRSVRLIFDSARDIRPAALLLLLAEIHRCRLVHGDGRVTGTYPGDQKLERMLDESGFFRLLRVRSRNPRPTRKYPVEYINFRSDNKLAANEPRKLREALLGDEISMDVVARQRLQRALTEAMLNVGHHAYPKGTERAHHLHGRWWLAGHVKQKNKELMVTFCDLGVGIPSTLPRKYPAEMIRAALSVLPGIKLGDGEMIQAGMELGRSRTGQVNRGRGLNDLRKIIDLAGAGEMHIFSRRGWYRYSAGGKETSNSYSTSIGATLIKWSVPLTRITDWTG